MSVPQRTAQIIGIAAVAMLLLPILLVSGAWRLQGLEYHIGNTLWKWRILLRPPAPPALCMGPISYYLGGDFADSLSERIDGERFKLSAIHERMKERRR